MKEVAAFLWESNRIEGIQRPEAMFLQALNNQITGDKHVDNSVRAWKYTALHYKKPLTWKGLFTLHRKQMMGLLPQKEVGCLRTGQVFVGQSIPPKAEVLHYHLESFFEHAAEKDPLTLHFEFESIHPFWDGNGRVGRLVWAWYRLQKGLPIYPILNEFVGSTFNDRRLHYYKEIAKYGESWHR